MKRKAFILTEILTGLMLQSMFVITLFGAFYMVLAFGTSTQQTLAANDSGQAVITYINNRIRNAGLGLWKCGSPLGVAEAFGLTQNPPTMTALTIKNGSDYTPYDLPVAVLSSEKGVSKPSVVSNDGVYEGNVLVLLYAHKDGNSDKLVVANSADIPAGTKYDNRYNFKFVNFSDKNPSNFEFGKWKDYPLESNRYQNYMNIKSWAVAEASGRPFRVTNYGLTNPKDTVKINAPYKDVTIYAMSELLNLECQKLYVQNSSFYFANIKDDGDTWSNAHPHTSGILELHMTLDTKPAIPILDLQVLVSEGLRDDGQTTQCPPNWPSSCWKSEFGDHRVHVSQATWKLYNLAPLFN